MHLEYIDKSKTYFKSYRNNNICNLNYKLW